MTVFTPNSNANSYGIPAGANKHLWCHVPLTPYGIAQHSISDWRVCESVDGASQAKVSQFHV